MKKDDVQLQRTYEKPITVFGKPLRIKRLILMGLSGTVLGIMGFLEVKLIFWFVVALFFASLLIFSLLLMQKSILYFGEMSLEVTPSGDIFITKLHGHCSKCDGHLKVVKKRKGVNKFISYLQCDKDASHVWNLYANEKEDSSK